MEGVDSHGGTQGGGETPLTTYGALPTGPASSSTALTLTLRMSRLRSFCTIMRSVCATLNR